MFGQDNFIRDWAYVFQVQIATFEIVRKPGC